MNKQENANKDNNSVLYIAFHYPPIIGSSGVHRTLAFTRYLNEHNWDTTVLTSSLKAYEMWSKEQFDFIPKGVKVIRAFGRSTAKDLSFKGKYLSWMALPDNWQSWIFGGVISGFIAIKKNRPKVIVSTYPIASAHIIAYILHKLTDVPWVADLRDPMAQENYPSDPRKKKIFHWIERKIIKHCKNAIVTTSGTLQLYRERFPAVPSSFWQLVSNGYDKKMFNELTISEKVEKDKITLLHSGLIYPSERDPLPLFQALARLKEQGKINTQKFELRLRATGHDAVYAPILEELNISDIVTLQPAVPFKQALDEMVSVDCLLLLQAANCDYQIPAKAYEYLKANKPVLALTTKEGDTGQLMARSPKTTIARLDDEREIFTALSTFIEEVKFGDYESLSEAEIESYSRQSQANIFEEILKNN